MGTKSPEDVKTCTKDAESKTTEEIRVATGDVEKTKKLFEEDLCKLYQEQLNCFGDDREACQAALPDLKKATNRLTTAMKSLYNVKECQFTCDGSALSGAGGPGMICPLLALTFLISFWVSCL